MYEPILQKIMYIYNVYIYIMYIYNAIYIIYIIYIYIYVYMCHYLLAILRTVYYEPTHQIISFGRLLISVLTRQLGQLIQGHAPGRSRTEPTVVP